MKNLLTTLVSAERQNSVRNAYRAIRAAGSVAIVVAGITTNSLAFAASRGHPGSRTRRVA